MDRIERTASIRENLIEYYTQIDDIKTILTFLDFASSGGSRQDPGGPGFFGKETCEIKEGTLEMTLCNCRADPDSNLNKIEA